MERELWNNKKSVRDFGHNIHRRKKKAGKLKFLVHKSLHELSLAKITNKVKAPTIVFEDLDKPKPQMGFFKKFVKRIGF